MWKSYDCIFYAEGSVDTSYEMNFPDSAIKDWRKNFSRPGNTWQIIIDKPDFIVMQVNTHSEFYRISINIREEE